MKIPMLEFGLCIYRCIEGGRPGRGARGGVNAWGIPFREGVEPTREGGLVPWAGIRARARARAR